MSKPEEAVDSDPLAFLVSPEGVASFLANNWEQRPAVFKATPERRAFFEGLASFSELVRLADICEEAGEPLEFGVDVNAARYVDGKRETPNGEVADSGALEQLYHEEGCTMQFHQPQRFSDETWRLLAALERRLGCLVGCNAYLTPQGTQGLAPHWDDVEIFVVQTEGCKRWRVYGPPPAPAGAPPLARATLLASCRLANQVSGDLSQEEIGEPLMEFTLEVGDVLYMPRGTIHQAVAHAGPSSHLTISTYQRWSAADLAQYTVSVALANPTLQPLLPAPLKAGLPLGFLSHTGVDASLAAQLAAAAGGFGEDGTAAAVAAAAKTCGGGGSGTGGRAEVARQLAAACRALADCLEGEGEGSVGPRLLATAADAMSEDFMRSRLPPHPAQLPPPGPMPTPEASVQCVGAGLFRLIPFNTKEDGCCDPDCEEDHDHHGQHSHAEHAEQDEHDDSGEDSDSDGDAAPGPAGAMAPPSWLRLVSCLRNDRGTHMMGGGGGEEGEEEESDDGSDSDSEDEEGGSGDDGSDADVEELAAAAAAARAAGRKRKQPTAADDGGEGDGGDGDVEGGSSDEDEDEDEEEQEQEDLVFPAEFGPALVQLLGTAPGAPAGGSRRPLPVSAIALPDPELQVQVAAALWEAGVVRTVESGAKRKVPKQGKGTAGKQQQAQEKQEKKLEGGKQQGQGSKPAKQQQQQQQQQQKGGQRKEAGGKAGKRQGTKAAAGAEQQGHQQHKGGCKAAKKGGDCCPPTKKHKA